jgi:RHS repeat-associated protein
MTGNMQKKYSGRLLSAMLLCIAILTSQTSAWAGGDNGIEKTNVAILAGSTLVSNSSPLVVNATTALTYTSETAENTSLRKIKNIVTLSVFEETPEYIPGDFTASVNVRIKYGASATAVDSIDQLFEVTYTKAEGAKYNAKRYFSFNNAAYVKITVLAITAPVVSGFDTKKALVLQNEMRVTRFYNLNTSIKPVLAIVPPAMQSDELSISWTLPGGAGNTHSQLEWTWLEDTLANEYRNGAVLDTNLLFKLNSTRIDLPVGIVSYKIPLLYGDGGKLYCRVRAVNINKTGNRTDGLWSAIQVQPFAGHNNALNWQATISFAEEGKRKAVIQYYDGSLRGRQTVTKDNSTNTVVSAETFYDGQGRPAIQVLPAPGVSNIMKYTTGLNLFEGQTVNADPTRFFDMQPLLTPNSLTTRLKSDTGASKYYSASNQDAGTGINAHIPDAEGYPYTVTRYTPDATGRIMAQSGVGAALQMGKGHETKYYYGTPAQEELDGLFGTEVGNYTHYFKNMVKDANGQMSVSYVDMNGRTIATALAGDAPAGMQALDLNTTQYPNQAGTSITRNLLNKNTNIVKNNSVESVTSLLVPATTNYAFRYELTPQVLQLTSCTNTSVCYDCMYNLEFAIADESGDAAPIIKKFNNVKVTPDDSCSTPVTSFKDEANNTVSNIIQFTQQLQPGSYTIRKTLTISEASVQTYKDMYITKGLCKAEQTLIDEVYTALLDSSTCDDAPPASACAACNISLGDSATYRTAYLKSIYDSVPSQVPANIELEIKASYKAAKQNCDRLCDTASQVLATKRTMMLADMIPYSGQYARDTGTTAMYKAYNVFSTTNTTTQPFYKKPKNSTKGSDYYRTPFNVIDSTILPRLSTISPDEFSGQFTYSWAEALLPYHPEYDKLVFAKDSLSASYNWITTFNNTTTFTQATINGYIFTGTANLTDTFYKTAASYKTDMATKVSGNYRNGLSLWQIAYGDVMCKTITSPTQKNSCYTSAAKYPPYNNLTTAQKDQVWVTFRNLYAMVRDSQVNAYINARRPLTDAQTLVDQGFLLHFATGNQLAQQYGKQQQTAAGENDWAWFPAAGASDPDITKIPDGASAATTYNSRCSSYINQWTQALLKCPAINNHASKTQIINQITAGMVTVCQKGSDANNPFGASNVAPGTTGTPISFEEVINNVFTQYGIAKTDVCNPFVIEFPKPYGKGPLFAKEMVSSIDTCHCRQFAKLKDSATKKGFNPAVLSSFNQYLLATYGDTLTVTLFNGLTTGCAFAGTTACYDTVIAKVIPSGSTIPCECTLVSGTSYNCRTRVCTTVNPYPLATAQPMPDFLKCGFVSNAKCFTCAQISSLVSEFKTAIPSPYNAGPVFTGSDLDTNSIKYNILFAKFVNYRTGMQYSWLEYAQAAAKTGCNLTLTNAGATQTMICSDSKPLNDTTGLLITESPCKPVYNMAVSIAQQLYQQRKEYLLADFEAQYRAKCLGAASLEQFTVNYTSKEYHYTLYYYDMAGNLVKTVAPRGVRPDFSATFANSVKTARANGTYIARPHVLTTNYRYNSLGKLVAQKTPDAGIANFWYDKLGRLVISRNAQQAKDGKYGYTLYDAFGRIAEEGQKPQTTAMTQLISQDPVAFNSWINISGGIKEQITFTVYDTAYPPLLATYMMQKNLRNRVSYAGTKKLATDSFQYAATFYTYDVHGNIDTLLQDYKGVAEMGAANRFKLMTYDFDLISGKVNMVSYQPEKGDAFYHRYNYDAENKLVTVETSRDKIYWERDAAYSYYKHGLLARVELGQLRVQGMDYAYTLQGWIKGVNSTVVGNGSFDIGKDGLATGNNSNVARDVLGYALHYYDSTGRNNNWIDYKAIGGASAFASPDTACGMASLYNGNISAISINNAGLAKGVASSTNPLPLFNKYQYDQLNRLVSMQVYKGLDAATNKWNAISINDYAETISYDPNGNILTYNRAGSPSISGKPAVMDSLTYYYPDTTNQLSYVNDKVTSATSTYTDDLETQSANNYTYDAIGNLKTDAKEGISGITWTAYGKIASIVKNGNTIAYTYDATGNRITKTTSSATTIYVCDATGNVLSVYEKPSAANLQQTEIHLYGISRVGITTKLTVDSQSVNLASNYGTARISTFTRNEKVFELSNHLSNVLATIGDKKVQNSSNNTSVEYYTASVLSASDYYPFGMTMPGRSYAGNGSYRYGFNGQEKSTEINNNLFSAQFWEYDSRIGRRWNLDPKPTIGVSEYTAFLNNPIWFSDPLGDTTRWNDSKGRPLMLLNDGRNEMITRRTKQDDKQGVYDLGIQWFEPLADNYMAPIWINPEIGSMDGIKHFSWDQLASFAMVDRSMASYGSGNSGDWKALKEGGDGNYLVTLDGKPYWADAIGQIPYAVGAFKHFKIQDGKVSNTAISETIETGMKHGDGCIVCMPWDGEYTNTYDNYMVLRGAMWANEMYRVQTIPPNSKDKKVTYQLQETGAPARKLGTSILQWQADRYIRPHLK